jgi:class 3 adenylate cyclase
MPNRREAIHQFYRGVPGSTLLTGATATSYSFKGPAMAKAIVVRTDLNGYSSWARGMPAPLRAAVLDEFFSAVVPAIDRAGGVYFRDEGDCIVALFSEYFGHSTDSLQVRLYCQGVTAKVYSAAELSAKTCVACGEIAIFQKRHEAPSGDWSAEGEPFVRAARLEQAASSIRHVVWYANDYDTYFKSAEIWAPAGTKALWNLYREPLRVPGVGAVAGWEDVVRIQYDP